MVQPESSLFSENWQTFYWDANYISEVYHNSGFLALLKSFFLQFYATKWSLALLYAIVLSIGAYIIYVLIISLAKIKYAKARWIVFAIGLICGECGLAFGFLHRKQSENDRFMEQMCLVRENRWQDIINKSHGRQVTNLLEQNMLNMALAETGQLDEHLMDQPCPNIYSIYVQQYESPYVVAMLSDIFWSMGHIGFSQEYAFQANEKLGNHSPRLLQRLADIAIVYGQYDLADRYLWWLDRTLFYRGWSVQRRSLLYDDDAVAADPELGPKRACIIKEDRFSGSKGLDKDLQCIIDQNPDYKPTAQFLNALKKLYYE